MIQASFASSAPLPFAPTGAAARPTKRGASCAHAHWPFSSASSPRPSPRPLRPATRPGLEEDPLVSPWFGSAGEEPEVAGRGQTSRRRRAGPADGSSRPDANARHPESTASSRSRSARWRRPTGRSCDAAFPWPGSRAPGGRRPCPGAGRVRAAEEGRALRRADVERAWWTSSSSGALELLGSWTSCGRRRRSWLGPATSGEGRSPTSCAPSSSGRALEAGLGSSEEGTAAALNSLLGRPLDQRRTREDSDSPTRAWTPEEAVADAERRSPDLAVASRTSPWRRRVDAARKDWFPTWPSRPA